LFKKKTKQTASTDVYVLLFLLIFGFIEIRNKLNITYMAIEVTDANFEKEVLQSNIPVIVDFWAEWCGPCRMVAPIVKEISGEFEGRAKVAKMDVDSNPDIPVKYGIRNIPTILFFKNGQIVDKQVGAVPKNVLVSKLEAIL
jgi:thioredoxin 1